MDKNYRGIAYKFGRKVHLDTLQCTITVNPILMLVFSVKFLVIGISNEKNIIEKSFIGQLEK